MTAPVAWGASAAAVVRLGVARTITPLVALAGAALVLLPVLFALLFASRGALAGDATPFLVARYDQLVAGLATPLLALLLGTSAFSAEAEDGTLLYLVTTTTPRWWIVAVRAAAAMAGTALLSALSVWGTGALATGGHDPAHVVRAYLLATAFGGAAYAALFTWLALVTRRALVTGLGYVLLWETVLVSSFPGLRYLSVRGWMASVAASVTSASVEQLAAAPPAPVAWVGAALLVFLTVVGGARRLALPRLARGGS